MANLMSSIVNGNLSVTGDIYGAGQCFMVDVTDSSAFNKMVTAYNNQKTIILRASITVSGASMQVIVPLTRVDVTSGSITKFTFSKAREYGEYVGIIDVWWSTSSSSGFHYDDPPADVYKALYAAEATHSDTSSSATTCSGNAATASECTGLANTATRATNDGSGRNIINTYVTKDELSAVAGWMWVVDTYYNKYDGKGVLVSSGTLSVGPTNSHYFDYIVYAAGYVRNIKIYAALGSGEQMFVPGRAGNGFQLKKMIPYHIVVNNLGSNSTDLKVCAGGYWTSIRSGTATVDGRVLSKDSTIGSWSAGDRSVWRFATLSGYGSLVWEFFWQEDTKTFSDVGTVPNDTVYLTTITPNGL